MSRHSNIYHDSCAILLQALLTQACRAILSLAAAARHASPERFVSTTSAAAVAHSCLSISSSPTIIESMNRHTLLTAVHLLCCEYCPYKACRHQSGELAAVVDTVLHDDALRSNILTALAELITRKWSKDEMTSHRLLRCALSVGPKVYTIVPSSPAAMSLPSALLQVYPQLASANEKAEVSCGCPHQWFRETLPNALLNATMEQHAQKWRNTNIFMTIFVRWRRRHGMSLLQRIAAATAADAAAGSSATTANVNANANATVITATSTTTGASPPEENASTRAQSSTHSEPLELPARHDTAHTYGLVHSHCHSCRSDTHLKHSKDASKHNDECSSIRISGAGILVSDAVAAVGVSSISQGEDGDSSLPLPLVPSPEPNCTANALKAEGTPTVPSDSDDCFIAASLRFATSLKRTVFHHWRDVRLVGRMCTKHIHMRLRTAALRCAWQRWAQCFATRITHRRVLAADNASLCLAAARREQTSRRVLLCWWRAFAVRRFGTRTIARRAFAQWRRAFLYSLHSSGKALPPIAARALVARCITHWRTARYAHAADRFFARRCLRAMASAVHWTQQRRLCGIMAQSHWRRSLTQQSLSQWRCAAKHHTALRAAEAFCAHYVRRAVLSQWRERRCRRVAFAQCLESQTTAQTQRRLKALFTQWRARFYMRSLGRVAYAQRRAALCASVLLRWQYAARLFRRWRIDREGLADTAHTRALSRLALMRWRGAAVALRKRRLRETQWAQLCEAVERRERRAVAGVFFAWKGRAQLRRRRSAARAPRVVVPVGVNQSFRPQQQQQQQQQQRNVSFGAESAAGDPLAALRAERALLRGMDSPQWQSAAQSRLFNGSHRSARAVGRGNQDSTLGMMTLSDVEEDFSPSPDNSGAAGVYLNV